MQVYQAAPLLKSPKETPANAIAPNAFEPHALGSRRFVPRWIYALYKIFNFYCGHAAFLPSFVLSLLYFTVLSFGAQMVTYLLSAGYESFHVALFRTLSVIFELSATWIAPMVMERIGPVRAGMWFLSWQMLWLGVAVSFFWAEPVSIVAAAGLVAGTILSRIGLWGYDLCAQFIIQEVSATATFAKLPVYGPSHPHQRKCKAATAGHFPPPRLRCRTHSSCSRTCRPSSGPIPINSDIQSCSAPSRSIRQASCSASFSGEDHIWRTHRGNIPPCLKRKEAGRIS